MPSTVFITGASSGIGKATVIYFQAKGWNVAATMRKPAAEHQISQLDRVRCLYLDVLEEQSIHQAIQETLQAFGNIDVLVNNAGYGAVGPFEASTASQVERQFGTNVFGLMNVTRALIPHFREKKAGTIINISSMGGRITFPLYSIYHGSKWAVEGFTESLYYELRPFNIRLRLIEPGGIRTDFYHRSIELIRKEGLVAYDTYYNRTFYNIQTAGENGPGPEVVARTIFRAAVHQGSRLRFPVGNNAPMLLFLKRLIPLSWFYRLVRMVTEKKQAAG
ncbi:MAG TPA: SDR family oxidoreductase [Chitinophagaceae bacterium]|nr:SDR family oxidoreductase [Chitinophagaceae bacterium]